MQLDEATLAAAGMRHLAQTQLVDELLHAALPLCSWQCGWQSQGSMVPTGRRCKTVGCTKEK